jgi:hypothetical protein
MNAAMVAAAEEKRAKCHHNGDRQQQLAHDRSIKSGLGRPDF